jgi:zinc transport system substrate-binding protein
MRPTWIVAAAAALACLGVACSGPTEGSSAQPSVVASFYPLAEAVRRVGGPAVSVTDLTPPGVEPHDLELTPDQIEAIDTADAVVYLGGDFQPAVQDALGDAAGLTVDVGDGLPALSPPQDGSDGDLAADPHVWLDPVLYGRIVEEVRDALTRVDPAGASTYAANAATFVEELHGLDQRYRRGLDGCTRDVLVTSHAAFGYLANRYGLVQQPIAGLSPDAEPTPQRLADLQALVEREGVTTIFTEELVSPEVAETLAREAGVGTAVLSPLESLTSEEVSDGEDYVSIMDRNLRTLRDALGCD